MFHLTATTASAPQKDLIRDVVVERARLDAVSSRKHARSEIRYPVRTRVDWSPLPPLAEALRNPAQAWCSDISSGGLGLLTPTPLRPGTRLHVDLRPLSPKAGVVPVTVAYCAALVPGVYQIGTRFDA